MSAVPGWITGRTRPGWTVTSWAPCWWRRAGPPGEHALISLLALNGLRVSEATGASIENLGVERGYRTLVITRKGGKVVTIPLAPRTARAIDRATATRTGGPILLNSRGTRMDRHAATRRLRQLADAAGVRIARAHPHMLRHTFVTTMLDAGVDLRDVQIAARHADPRTTMRYVNSRELHRMGEIRAVCRVRSQSGSFREGHWTRRLAWGSCLRISLNAGFRRPGVAVSGAGGCVGGGDLAGAARLELVSGVVQLRPEDAMVEAMLAGWHAQQAARGLQQRTIAPRERLMRRFLAFTSEYPWHWGPAHVDEWTQSLTGERHLAPSTIRGYQTDLRLFTEYLCDGRYGWAAACEEEFGPGVHPVPVCHEWNTIAHLNDYEGSPEGRPFTREELQRFLDYADDQVDRVVAAKRKGALAAYRDATLFKVIYAWGLRRTETSRLDLADWGRNPAVPEFGRFGMLHVRYGKAVRGQQPRRRNVPSVMGWAVDAVADYVENIRPKFGSPDHPALWVTERGGRVKPAEINARFVACRDALGLPKALTPHSLRHSWVTHLTEDGVDRRFIQEAVGHRCDTSTAIYTHVSGDFMNTALRKALAPALDGQPG